MKNKNVLLITALSLLACIAHGAMLFTPFNNYIYTSAVKIILFVLCPILYFMFSKEGKLKDLFFLKGNIKSIKYSLLLGVVAFVTIFIAFAVIPPWLDESMIINAMLNVGITRDNYIFAVMYYLIINVALEELFFRGFIFLTLYRMNYKYYAHLYSSLLFAIYHVAIMKYGVTPGLLLISTIGLVCVGLIFNEITRRCNNVFGSYALHISASLAISLIGFYFLYQ